MKNIHSDSRRARTRDKKRGRLKFAKPKRLSPRLWNQKRPPTKPQSVSKEELSGCRCLYQGAHIGNESRTLEFKRGEGNYLKDVFYSHVCMYGCAFLNCSGGTLLVGVSDDGVVRGVWMDQKMEDHARLRVDDAVKTFRPTLFPCNYSLDFLPVIKSGKETPNLKVVRLSFRPPPAPVEPTLFQSGTGEVYIKRDGGVQGPLSVPCILEWNKQMWSNKVRQLEQRVYEARCEQSFLSGLFSWFTAPQRLILASLPTKAPWADGRKRLTSSQESQTSSCNLLFQEEEKEDDEDDD